MSFQGSVAHFFLALNNIPFWIYQSLIIHLPTEEYCFQVLAIANKAAVYIFVCRFLCGHKLSTHLGKYQGTCLQDQMANICFVF